MRSAIALFMLTISAAAGPLAQPLEQRGSNALCNVVNKVVTAAKEQAAATAYCASILSISQLTSTTTATTSTVSVSTATVFSSTSTITTTTQLTCLAPPTSTAAAPTKRELGSKDSRMADLLKEKRGKTPVKKPSCLESYGSSQLITSACKCLSIQPSTTTTTILSTSTSTSVTTTSLVASETAVFTNNFKIAVSGTPDDGRYIQAYNGFGTSGAVQALTYADGSLFSLDPNGALIAQSSTGGQCIGCYATYASGNGDAVTFASASYLPMDDTMRLNCNVAAAAADGTCAMSCSVGAATIENVCIRATYFHPWYLGTAPHVCGSGYTTPNGLPFSMYAVTA